MEPGVLHLFPERGLDQSILVAVLIGIYVLLFFTEVFGWVWAGLVVPGYLASVFAVQPAAGVAVVFEAVLTFGASRLISDVASRLAGWSPFFGRERFFLIVLVSVGVRQASELWLIEDVLGVVDGVAGTSLAPSRDFSSLGLVLVPLLANMFWKLTLPRGVFQIGVSVAITWAAVALVLLPYTNLSLSSFELTYEDVALDFLGSPKAYIILLTTAFLAAHGNLAYGWDYNGILVPSLMALTWFHPTSLISTVIEALVLLYATRAALALPVLRSQNLEGPRKVTVVFTAGFLLKYAAGWAIGDRWPGFKLTDAFGFGYVLTSLVAVKMLNVKKVGRVMLPSVAVSFVGFVVGSAIGFALELAAPRPAPPPAVEPVARVSSRRLVSTPAGAMAAATVRARPEVAARDGAPARTRARHAALWRAIDAWLAAPAAAPPAEVRERALELGLGLWPADDGGWVLIELEERLHLQRGWELAVLYPGAPGPVIAVPRPRREQPAAALAPGACARLACRAIVASGTDGDDPASAAHPLGHPRATFVAALRALERAPVVQLRVDAAVTPGAARLHVRHTIPDAVRVPALWPGRLELTWEPPPGVDRSWARRRALVVLRVHPDDAWAALTADAAPPPAVDGSVVAWLARWLDAPPRPPATPTQTELLVLEQLVVEPLVAATPARAAWLATVAATLDHELAWLPDGAGPGQGAWALAGAGGAGTGWLAVAVAAAPRIPLVLEVPRPRSERGAAAIAAEAWAAAGGAAVVVDAQPGAGALDPTTPGHVATPLQAAHQALYRAVLDAPGAAVVQVRGFGAWRGIPDELVVSLGAPLLELARAPAAIAALVGPDGALGRGIGARRWVDGGADVAPLAGTGAPQLAYAQSVLGPPFAIVWFAEHVRARASGGGGGDAAAVRARGARFGVEVIERPIDEALLAPPLAAPSPAAAAEIAAAERAAAPALALADAYAATGDVAALAALARTAPRGAVRLGWSPELSLGYLWLELRRGAAVTRRVWLDGAAPPSAAAACAPIAAGPDARDAVWAAAQARCPRLVVVGQGGQGGEGAAP